MSYNRRSESAIAFSLLLAFELRKICYTLHNFVCFITYRKLVEGKKANIMNEWFTIEEIDHTTFAISEYKHWEKVHSYLVCGTDRALLIDTGLGVSNIEKVVRKLTDLPVLVATTHVHWDHIGGHRYFDSIAVFKEEAAWLEKFPISLEEVKQNLLQEACQFPKDFSPANYTLFSGKAQMILSDGDIIELGNRSLQIVHTPGHSPGHCCFYEKEKKYLYTGDLIYKGCLDAFYPTTDPKAFYQSLLKIRAFEIVKILPGHYQLPIEAGFLNEVIAGFKALDDAGKLYQGSGRFDYPNFQIHI